MVRGVDVIHRKLVYEQYISYARIDPEQTSCSSSAFQSVDDVSILANIGVHRPDLQYAAAVTFELT